ncbi:MAG: Hsp20/alpha crystallin family protein [Treponema sp.]|nr:Hsp20/alpha crystallin family protein [Treponema sp.]
MRAITLHRPNTIQNALSDLDRYFESFFGDSVFVPATREYARVPAVDVRETEKTYMLDMELPGHDEKGIEIHVDGGRLSISSKQEDANKKEEAKAGTQDRETWLIRERRSASFSRSFKLPEDADPDGVSAEFKNGILSLEIKKRAEAQKRSIRINVK